MFQVAKQIIIARFQQNSSRKLIHNFAMQMVEGPL
jgi:hypothetical protein